MNWTQQQICKMNGLFSRTETSFHVFSKFSTYSKLKTRVKNIFSIFVDKYFFFNFNENFEINYWNIRRFDELLNEKKSAKSFRPEVNMSYSLTEWGCNKWNHWLPLALWEIDGKRNSIALCIALKNITQNFDASLT